MYEYEIERAKKAYAYDKLLARNREMESLLKVAILLTEKNLGLNHQWLLEARAVLSKKE